jgi:hypothetical protein
MKNPNKLTATGWKALEDFEERVGASYVSKGPAAISPLDTAETLRLLHDVREYKTYLRDLKRKGGTK